MGLGGYRDDIAFGDDDEWVMSGGYFGSLRIAVTNFYQQRQQQLSMAGEGEEGKVRDTGIPVAKFGVFPPP